MPAKEKPQFQVNLQNVFKAESEKGSGAMYRHLRHTTLDGAATKLPNEGQVCSAHAARDGPSPILASSSNIL